MLPAVPLPLLLLLEMHAPSTCAHRSFRHSVAGPATPGPRMIRSPLTVIVILPPLPPPLVFSAVISLPACISICPPGTVMVMSDPLAAPGPSHLMLPVLVISKSSPAGSVSTYGHNAGFTSSPPS